MNRILVFLCNFLFFVSCFFYWFKFFYSIKNFQKVQNNILKKFLKQNKYTLFGINNKFNEIKSFADFRQQISVSEYEHFNFYIEKIKNGEANILTKSKIKLLEPTSGSISAVKFIPYNEDLRQDFQKGIKVWLFDLYLHNPKLLFLKSYWLITPNLTIETNSKVKIGFENDNEYFGKIEKFFLNTVTIQPNLNGDYLNNTKNALFKEKNSIGLLSFWSPSILDSIFQNTYADFNNLKIVSCWADGNSLYYINKVKKYFPNAIIQPKGLLSTESIVSFPLWNIRNSVVAYQSHFFEFKDSNNDIFLLNELELNKEYTVIITTSGGLCRYNTHDKVKVTGFYKTLPIIKFLGRDNNISDFFGEKLSEVFVKDVCEKLFKKHNIKPEFFIMTFSENHYILNLETNEDIDINNIENDIETELERNFHYKNCIEAKQLSPLKINLINNGLEKYNKFYIDKGIKLGNIKQKILDANFELP